MSNAYLITTCNHFPVFHQSIHAGSSNAGEIYYIVTFCFIHYSLSSLFTLFFSFAVYVILFIILSFHLLIYNSSVFQLSYNFLYIYNLLFQLDYSLFYHVIYFIHFMAYCLYYPVLYILFLIFIICFF